MWRIVVVTAFAVGVAGCLPEGNRNEAQHNLEQERECGKQAARAFNEQWKEFAQGHDQWESHHNPTLNRCLLKVLSPGVNAVSIFLTCWSAPLGLDRIRRQF